ncbi:hypothetical protein LPJ75_007223 [Coemansia sp. RSA 2598]|nr:hypothetical protein LPJ75_007223 [Coemansia sp. RSA 2598]
MDPRSPLSLSRPPPSEDPQAENSTPGRSAKRKRDSRRRSGEKEEDKETADDCDADKRRRSEGTGENGSADTTKRARIMFKCAVCLDTPDPAVFVHPCGHVFCEACAQGAVQSTRKCPVCRHQMRARDIRVLQFRVASIKR